MPTPMLWRRNYGAKSRSHVCTLRYELQKRIYDSIKHCCHACRQGAANSKGTNGSADQAVVAAPKKQKMVGGKGQALPQIFKLLLSIAGPKIIALLGLALARTALSNRLARLQVRTPPWSRVYSKSSGTIRRARVCSCSFESAMSVTMH